MTKESLPEPVHPDEPTRTPASLPRLSYSVAEAAQVLGIGRTLVYALIARGELPSVKIGARRVVRHEALVAFLAEREGVES
jgi:excisionase family DNA binding protein